MSPTTVISNVRVFDGQRLGDITTVVIENGLISPEPSTSDQRSGADLVDGAGGTLLPGLIDTHVHIDTVAHLEAAAEWGITTLLDMGHENAAQLAILQHRSGLPTLKMAGSPASAPNSMFVKKMGHPENATVATPDDAARFVRQRVEENADYIKILVEDPHVPGSKPLGPERVAAIIRAAHDAGLTTIAHVVSADTLDLAVRAGVDIVTHVALTTDPDAEFEAMLAKRPVTIIPTLTMMQGVVHAVGGKLFMRALGRIRPSARLDYAHAKATVATFHRAGMVILAGTDSNDNHAAPYQVPHGRSLHEELERLVGAGLTPVEALQGTTSAAAATFGLTDRGAIEPGLRADLVLVDGDPTRTISATRNVREVWIGGTRVKAAR